MSRFLLSAAPLLLAAAIVAQPALAQNPAPSPGTQPAAPTTPAETAAPAASGTPQLVVASVKLNGGWRTSKFVGSVVYDSQNHKIGSVDDLVVTDKDRITYAILSVGGFLGMGNKLVAVKFDQLRYDPTAKDAKVTMPDATKESLAAMPNFTFGND